MRRPEKHFATPATVAVAKEAGATLRAGRVARRRTLDDAAERARVSRRTLHRIESGDVAVAFGSWLAVIESLGLLHLLAPLTKPASDAVGEALRAERTPRRPRKAPSEDKRHDF
jgi:transcriptional regulator with XRE-family HTH domain